MSEPTPKLERDFYTEKGTSLIHEVKFFPTFVLTRPVSPDRMAVQKLSLFDFSKEFEDFCGDKRPLWDFLSSGEDVEDTEEGE